MILVVEDNAAMASALVALIRALDHEATAVLGGREALDFIRQRTPNLMLLDLQMPGVSGFDVLRTLRQEGQLDRLPVVVCSATASPRLRDEALRLGAQDFVAKDRVAEELQGVIARLLGPEAAGAAGSAA